LTQPPATGVDRLTNLNYWSIEMKGLDYRLMEFLAASGNPALLVDTSAGLSLGALPGLEDFEKAVQPILPMVEGVVCSPGQLRRLKNRTRHDAALLVRMDWTNTLRGKEFPLPPEKASYLTLLNAGDALELGQPAWCSASCWATKKQSKRLA
jgi:DhnA family fructose-bisphosphate aldolase class Ia